MTPPRAATSTVAVVTIAAGRRTHLDRQIDSLISQTRPPDRYVVVDMGGPTIERDLSTVSAGSTVLRPPGLGTTLQLSRCRNLGYEAADADVVILLDVDCIASTTLVADYAARCASHRGLHAGPVGYLPARTDDASWDLASLGPIARYQPGRPSPATPLHRTDRFDLFWSLSFALDRRTWDRIGGFDERFVGYGGEDTDFARRAEHHGVDLWFGGSAAAFHQYHPTHDPPVQHLDSICRNAAIYHDKWGEWPMVGWLRAFAAAGAIEWEPDASSIRVAAPPAGHVFATDP